MSTDPGKGIALEAKVVSLSLFFLLPRGRATGLVEVKKDELIPET
jgi:hypothetical protein